MTGAVMKSRSQHPRRLYRCTGVVLLEVVVSLGILLVAMGVIGLIFSNGQHTVELAEQMTRGMLMTERLHTELKTKMVDMDSRIRTGLFESESIPGMSWRIEINPSELIDGMEEIDYTIYMGDPAGDEDQLHSVMSMRFLRGEPRGLDPTWFGVDEDNPLPPNLQDDNNEIPLDEWIRTIVEAAAEQGISVQEMLSDPMSLLDTLGIDVPEEFIPILLQVMQSVGGNTPLPNQDNNRQRGG